MALIAGAKVLRNCVILIAKTMRTFQWVLFSLYLHLGTDLLSIALIFLKNTL